MKAVREVIAANGVPYLKMASMNLTSNQGRQRKERRIFKKLYSNQCPECHVNLSVKDERECDDNGAEHISPGIYLTTEENLS
jgi:hypothetical protein